MAGVKLDHKGIAELLKSAKFGQEVNAAAEKMAEATRAEIGDGSVEVVVDRYTTDRQAAAVVIADAAGVSLQAKHGVLTKSAGSVGLEVRAK